MIPYAVSRVKCDFRQIVPKLCPNLSKSGAFGLLGTCFLTKRQKKIPHGIISDSIPTDIRGIGIVTFSQVQLHMFSSFEIDSPLTDVCHVVADTLEIFHYKIQLSCHQCKSRLQLYMCIKLPD